MTHAVLNCYSLLTFNYSAIKISGEAGFIDKGENTEKGCQKPAAQQKTTDDGEKQIEISN